MTLHSTAPAGTSALRRERSQAGLSLLEVMIATGIMAASSMALLRLGRIGNQHALRSESLSEVVMLAQNKLHALEAGIEPLVIVERQPFRDHPEWEYTLHAEPETTPSLWRVTIEVFARQPSLGLSGDPRKAGITRSLDTDDSPSSRRSLATATDDSRPPRWSLTQWIRCAPPAAEGATAEAAPRSRRSQLIGGGVP
ncbi:MAG: hypothetical protein VX346_17795 [Planctomycetota bacterium]|nr:hypothetical protein [Planctomycetota bacterium]